MRKTPYATVQDALQAVPVNMGSTFNEAFGGVGNYARGCGESSWVGAWRDAGARQRAASALLGDTGGLRRFVQHSWSAVDRIEVLPDGASALYGSDAIAGVVNVIMRQSFSGAETQARYGMAQGGGADQKLISQLFGTSWGSGSALMSYQYSERTGLADSAREYTASEDQRPLGGTDHRGTSSNPETFWIPRHSCPRTRFRRARTARL